MTLLSILIPVHAAEPALEMSLARMLASPRRDFEILLADFTGGAVAAGLEAAGLAADARLRLIAPALPATAPDTVAARCNLMIPEVRGAWVSVIEARDYADPDIAAVIEAVVKRVPDADALSWGRAAYTPPELRATREIAVVPTGSRMLLPPQADVLRSLFYWDGAGDRPACHFGAWHGALRRDLLEQIRAAYSDVFFEQDRPDLDSQCKTVTLAKRLVMWERPLSVQCAAHTQAAEGQGPAFPDFPFNPDTGPAAAAAVAIERFKRRYGIALDGWEDGFIRACARDCETADTGEGFHSIKNAYAEAIGAWRGKRGLAAFKPEFRRKPKLTRFKGLRGDELHFDMAMDNTRTAADFYRLINALLFPVHLLDEKLA